MTRPTTKAIEELEQAAARGLRKYRESKERTLLDVSIITGMDAGMLSRYELGKTVIPLRLLLALADHDGITIDMILKGGDGV